MADEAEVTQLESIKTRQLLVIVQDEDGELVIEESDFKPWAISGIAMWLGMWAEKELEAEDEDE